MESELILSYNRINATKRERESFDEMKMCKFTELTDQEKFLKKLYQGEGQKILSTPMQYAAYKKLMQEHPEYELKQDVYSEYSKDHQGITVTAADKINETGDIYVVQHERYGYPIFHNHAFVEIAYVYSGRCTHCIEYRKQQSFEMTAGDLCILAPETMHAITALEDDAVILNILMSKEELDHWFLKMVKEKQLLAEFFENVLYGKSVSPYILFPTGDDGWIRQTFREMYQETRERSYAYRESLELYVRQLFIHVLRNYEMLARVSEPMNHKPEENAAAILGYISANYNKATLKSMAEFFNYSESYMSRFLKKYTGQTFGALVTSLQMKHAAELLSEKSQNHALTEIAQEVGCFDYSHFSRKFKKIYGISPDQYRKKYGR